jgi:hypothetical protein
MPDAIVSIERTTPTDSRQGKSKSSKRPDAIRISNDGREPDDDQTAEFFTPRGRTDESASDAALVSQSSPALQFQRAAYRLVRKLFSLPSQMRFLSTFVVMIVMIMVFAFFFALQLLRISTPLKRISFHGL